MSASTWTRGAWTWTRTRGAEHPPEVFVSSPSRQRTLMHSTDKGVASISGSKVAVVGAEGAAGGAIEEGEAALRQHCLTCSSRRLPTAQPWEGDTWTCAERHETALSAIGGGAAAGRWSRALENWETSWWREGAGDARSIIFR